MRLNGSKLVWDEVLWQDVLRCYAGWEPFVESTRCSYHYKLIRTETAFSYCIQLPVQLSKYNIKIQQRELFLLTYSRGRGCNKPTAQCGLVNFTS